MQSVKEAFFKKVGESKAMNDVIKEAKEYLEICKDTGNEFALAAEIIHKLIVHSKNQDAEIARLAERVKAEVNVVKVTEAEAYKLRTALVAVTAERDSLQAKMYERLAKVTAELYSARADYARVVALVDSGVDEAAALRSKLATVEAERNWASDSFDEANRDLEQIGILCGDRVETPYESVVRVLREKEAAESALAKMTAEKEAAESVLTQAIVFVQAVPSNGESICLRTCANFMAANRRDNTLSKTVVQTALNALDRLDAYRASQPTAGSAFGADTPWPLTDAVRRLCEATEHLIDDHSCDSHGHETARDAVRTARAWLASQPTSSGGKCQKCFHGQIDVGDSLITCNKCKGTGRIGEHE